MCGTSGLSIGIYVHSGNCFTRLITSLQSGPFPELFAISLVVFPAKVRFSRKYTKLKALNIVLWNKWVASIPYEVTRG
jgi:hypothetical protein